MPKLSDFLTTGQLGPVLLGMRHEQVVGLLGEPDDESARRRPVRVLRYGPAELTFAYLPDSDDARLAGIALHFGRSGDGAAPAAIAFDDFRPTELTTEAEVRAFVNAGGTGVHASVRGEQGSLVLDTGASFTFADDRLASIHFRRRDKRTARTQLTVSLSDVAADAIRQRARDDGVTVSELIENLVHAF